MTSSAYHETKARIAARERAVVAAWLAQLPADGWAGTATALADELGLIADALGRGHYPPGPNSVVRRLGVQAGDGGPAGVVGAQDLAEEHPQGDERGEHPVQPPADGGHRLCEQLVGEDIGERQAAVLEELPAEEGRVPAEGFGVPHRLGSVPVRG